MRRVPPMFQPSVWSVDNATMEGNPRTNNVCEGWNNKFHTLVGSSHPSIWTVIKWFQLEQSTVTTVVQQDSVGTQPAKRVSQKLVLLQKRIQNLCHDRVSGRKTIPEFLYGIACNIRLSTHYNPCCRVRHFQLKRLMNIEKVQKWPCRSYWLFILLNIVLLYYVSHEILIWYYINCIIYLCVMFHFYHQRDFKMGNERILGNVSHNVASSTPHHWQTYYPD